MQRLIAGSEEVPDISFFLKARPLQRWLEENSFPFRCNPRLNPFSEEIQAFVEKELPAYETEFVEIRPTTIVVVSSLFMGEHYQWDWDGWEDWGEMKISDDVFHLCQKEYKLTNGKFYTKKKLTFKRKNGNKKH